MELLESDKLKIRILRCLDKQSGAVSLNSLKKKVGEIIVQLEEIVNF